MQYRVLGDWNAVVQWVIDSFSNQAACGFDTKHGNSHHGVSAFCKLRQLHGAVPNAETYMLTLTSCSQLTDILSINQSVNQHSEFVTRRQSQSDEEALDDDVLVVDVCPSAILKVELLKFISK